MCLYKCERWLFVFLWIVSTLYEREQFKPTNVPVQRAYDYYPEITNTSVMERHVFHRHTRPVIKSCLILYFHTAACFLCTLYHLWVNTWGGGMIISILKCILILKLHAIPFLKEKFWPHRHQIFQITQLSPQFKSFKRKVHTFEVKTQTWGWVLT